MIIKCGICHKWALGFLLACFFIFKLHFLPIIFARVAAAVAVAEC